VALLVERETVEVWCAHKWVFVIWLIGGIASIVGVVLATMEWASGTSMPAVSLCLLLALPGSTVHWRLVQKYSVRYVLARDLE
jgi:hypothetical protein